MTLVPHILRCCLAVSASVLVGCGLVSPPQELEEPLPALDFAELYDLGDLAFSVTGALGYTDDEIVDKFQTDQVRVEVFSRVIPTDTGPTRWALLTDDTAREHILAFAGTSTDLQWQLDLDITPYFDEDVVATLHRGFTIAAKAGFSAAVYRLNPAYRVRVTGFSRLLAISCG